MSRFDGGWNDSQNSAQELWSHGSQSERPDGRLELHEVKGSPRVFFDDAKCKVKVVATSFPFAMKVVYPRAKKNGGGWDVDEF